MSETPTIRLSICKTCGGHVTASVKWMQTIESKAEFDAEVYIYDLEVKEMPLEEYRKIKITWCKCQSDDVPIKWAELQDAYFAECVENGKITMLPHDLFEWMKNEINEYLKK